MRGGRAPGRAYREQHAFIRRLNDAGGSRIGQARSAEDVRGLGIRTEDASGAGRAVQGVPEVAGEVVMFERRSDQKHDIHRRAEQSQRAQP